MTEGVIYFSLLLLFLVLGSSPKLGVSALGGLGMVSVISYAVGHGYADWWTVPLGVVVGGAFSAARKSAQRGTGAHQASTEDPQPPVETVYVVTQVQDVQEPRLRPNQPRKDAQ